MLDEQEQQDDAQPQRGQQLDQVEIEQADGRQPAERGAERAEDMRPAIRARFTGRHHQEGPDQGAGGGVAADRALIVSAGHKRDRPDHLDRWRRCPVRRRPTAPTPGRSSRKRTGWMVETRHSRSPQPRTRRQPPRHPAAGRGGSDPDRQAGTPGQMVVVDPALRMIQTFVSSRLACAADPAPEGSIVA
jgi:hypothetical protein